jgi:hypothetical protein
VCFPYQSPSLPAARIRRSDVIDSRGRIFCYHFLNLTALITQLVILDNFAVTLPNLKLPVPQLFKEEEGFPNYDVCLGFTFPSLASFPTDSMAQSPSLPAARIRRSDVIDSRRELWLGLFDSSGHNAYGNAL